MTCQPSTSSAEVSPASPSVSPGRDSAPTTTAGSGPTSPAPFAYYDPDTHSWKTSQGSLFAEWETYSERWPRSGTLRSGAAYLQPPWVLLISAGASSYWPTPTARLGSEQRGPQAKRYWNPQRSYDLDDAVLARTPTAKLWPTPTVEGNRNRASYPGKSGDGLQTAVIRETYPTPAASRTDAWTMEQQRYSGQARAKMRDAGTPFQTENGGSLNPAWVEWLMGFPIGWTDLEG
jgi:hypothetical protein